MRAVFALVLLIAAGCASGGLRRVPPSPWLNPAGGVQDPELALFCKDLWELRMRQNPVWSTQLGDGRYSGKLPADLPAQRAHELEERRRFYRSACMIDPNRMQGEDRITLALVLEELSLELANDLHSLEPHTWNISGLDGPQVRYLSLGIDQPRATKVEREQYLERWDRMPNAITRTGEDLREGLLRGKTAPHQAVTTVIAQLDALLATPPHESPLVTPTSGGGRWLELLSGEDARERLEAEGFEGETAEELLRTSRVAGSGDSHLFLPAEDDDLDAAERARFVGEALRITSSRIYPAFRRYRAILADEILPAARSDEDPGLVALPGGLEYYDLMIRRHTSLQLTPQEIHELGLAELERIHDEMRTIGERVFGESDLATIQARLREDPELHFTSGAEIRSVAEECVARAEAAVPAVFGFLPSAPCEVVPVPAHEAPDTTIAYYRGPAPDGSRPGRYYVNTYAPTTRPRYEAEVLAYHEAVPGHHTQIAVAQELTELPLVRRHGGVTAYVEGWALYTERLCDELGLYSGDLDRLGVLSFDSWRASRLVVDTGLHAMGWSRQEAIDFLVANTLLARNNCENEVDRYIAWPGQALAYKLGQREILALRAEASEALGDSFRLADFHDVVLGSGAVSLGALRMIVEEWVASGGGDPRNRSN